MPSRKEVTDVSTGFDLVLYRKVLAFPASGHMATPMKLLDQVRQNLRAGYYSYRTEQAYVHWIVRYIRWHADIHRRWRHPIEMGATEVEAFLSHLAVFEPRTAGAIIFTRVACKP